MPTIQINRSELIHALQTEQWIITPNQHLVYELLDTCLKHTDISVQKLPNCLPYTTFVSTCYEHLTKQQPTLSHPILLTTQQARLLWQQACITQKKTYPPKLIETAFSAWQLCQTWNIPFEDSRFHQTVQSKHFQRWSHRFHMLLKENQLITEMEVVPYLLAHLLKFPFQKIIFACFDDFNPQQQNLQTHLEQLGIPVCVFDYLADPSSTPRQPRLLIAEDEKSEQEAILSWLKAQSYAKPVALIVPNLEQQADTLKRWLQMHFPHTAIYFSLGKPLAHYPLIDQMMMCLSLDGETFSLTQVNCLLQSSSIPGGLIEKNQRLQLLSALPKQESFGKKQFITLLKSTCPELERLLAELPTYPDEASPAHWATYWLQRLSHFDFTNIPLHSAHFQACQRFTEVILSLQHLSLIMPILSAKKALSCLQTLVQYTPFQPKQPLNATIHVLGPFEAAGSTYAASWIMNLTDQQWPGNFTLNPFIPYHLQCAFRLPHTDFEHERNLAKIRLERFQHAHGRVTFSYPQKTQDVMNRPSPFIPTEVELIVPFPKEPNPINSMVWETYHDPHYIPLSAEEMVTRSTAILSEQAKCPFRSFASHRLKSSPPEPAKEYLSSQLRGILLHRSLELLWSRIPSQQSLLSSNAALLESQVEQATRLALKQLSSLSPHFPVALLPLEQERISRLLLSSFHWETDRASFRVESLEETFFITLGPLTFRIRVDRIDRLNPHEKWVIDYKTTLPTPLPWQTSHPLEPQLLLYALIDPSIQGLVFHELKKGQLRVKGVTANPHAGMAGVKLQTDDDWENHREQWRIFLTQLAHNFHSGHCEAQPADLKICQTCDVSSLCRRAYAFEAP